MEHFLTSHGYLALGVLAFIQACCIPIPSEVTIGFAGVLAGEGHLNLALVIMLATVCELIGSFVAFGIGRKGGRPLVERFGRLVLVTPSDLDRAERWLDGRGEVAVAVGRALPFVRALVSVAAGIVGMGARRFGLFSLLGTLVYASVLASIGYAVGTAWHQVLHDFSLAGYVVLAVVVVSIGLFFARRIRALRSERATAPVTVAVEEE